MESGTTLHAIINEPPHGKTNQRTNGPVNAHLRPEIYICTNKLALLD